MVVCIILIVLGAFILAYFLFEKCRKYSLKATLVKSICSLTFIGLGLYGLLSKTMNIMGICFVFALVFGLCGDIFLDFKYVFKEEDRQFTVAGFVVFAIGHVLYMTGMYTEYYVGDNVLYIIIPLSIGIIASLINTLLGPKMKLNYGDFKVMVFVYGALLFSMVLSAGSLLILHNFQNTTLWMVFIGGVLFALSDLILSGTYFGEGKERPVDIITNSVTYYAAQYLIAFSLFFM